MIQVSYFPNIKVTAPLGISSLAPLFETIRVGGKDGRLRRDVEEIRRYPDDPDTRRELKRKNLPVITWQGIFSSRKDAGVQELSGLMCIDIDHLSSKELGSYKASLIGQPWCVAVFLSPSGDGLKAVVMTDNYDIEAYHSCYCQLEEYFLVNYGVRPDKNCEPLSQGCFASYDPDIYVNLNAVPFHLEYSPAYDQKKSIVTKTSGPAGQYHTPDNSFIRQFQNNLNVAINDLSDERILEILHRRFSRYPQNYTDGNRTRSVFVQATILCQAGIPKIKALDYLISMFTPTGFLKDKVVRETESAYAKLRTAFGSERGNYLSYPNYLQRKRRRSNL